VHGEVIVTNTSFVEPNPESTIGAPCSQLADEDALARSTSGNQRVFFRDSQHIQNAPVSDRSQNHEERTSLRDSPSSQPDRTFVDACHGGTADLSGFAQIDTRVSINGSESQIRPFGGRCLKICLFLFLLALSQCAAGQAGAMSAAPAGESSEPVVVRQSAPPVKREADEMRQELDVDISASSKIPADPLIERDPLAPVFQSVDKLSDGLFESDRLKFGATYTFLNQYATITPNEVRHDQFSGRLDFTGAWAVYDRGSSSGSISLLVRSETNIGRTQQFNLSDSIGSGLYLNCLQGGGPQEPVTVNVLYWREDFLKKKLSFYVGKLHPNEFVSLSMFNNDERTQFLNGANDGNLGIASDGTYAGGGAVEIQATPHFYIHAIAVDTEGAQQRNIETLVDRKFMEGAELGWRSGFLGEQYRRYRLGMWRDDTKNQGSGYGGGFGFDHELNNGWTPFGRLGLSTGKGSGIKQQVGIGLAQVHPFGRRGDMLGMAYNYTVASQGKHHESVFESFYRVRLTQRINIGPDVEVSIHPAYAAREYTTTLLGMRTQITF
jgi:porin